MKTNWAKWLVIQLVLIVFILAIAEVLLRFRGYQAGNIQPTWNNFKTVDTLIEIKHFMPESHGILIANKDFYAEVNDWGFRFDKGKIKTENGKRVMLIGDSFAWGMSAEPIDSSFASLLDKNSSFNILNFGIPGADPVQYAAVANLYIDSVRPDIIVVAFYTGNDVMLYDRDIHTTPFYYTNAGALASTDGEVLLPSAQAAYHYYAFDKYRIKQPKTLVENLAFKSALAARFYALSLQWTDKIFKDSVTKDMLISKKYLYEIQRLCAAKNVQFIIAIIPEYKELAFYRTPFETKYKALFQDSLLKQHCFVPQLESNMYYPYPDAHFNNKGHKAYTDFLEKIILQP